MKKERFFELLNHIDEGLIARAEEADSKQRKKKGQWIRWAAVAVCLCLIIGAAIAVPVLKNVPATPAEDPNDHPVIFDATLFPDRLTGSSLEFVVGSSSAIGGNSSDSAPPAFRFEIGSMIVKAKAVKCFPDLYYMLDVSSEYQPTAYRLIQMETVELIHGEELTQYFLYMLPGTLWVDLSVYDSLLISMTQIGTEQYALRNGTRNQIESFPLPVFGDDQNHPELGNMIAFTDGVFDESLWQTPGWIYGYQFAKYELDNPEAGDLVVSRGGTESATVKEIETRILDTKKWLGDDYQVPRLITLAFTSQAAKDALAFVKPFENGVFSQTIRRYHGELLYRRWINGCQTEETVTINLFTEEVTYSDVRYTKEDLSALEDISVHIADKAKAYMAQIPSPPHTNPNGKELLCLNLYGWYVKVGDRVYGVVKTVWKYKKGNDWYTQYYDEAYTLFDSVAATAQNISREDLINLVGTRNIYQGKYGAEINLPME